MATRLKSSVPTTSLSKDLVIHHMRQRAHVFSGLHFGQATGPIKPIIRGISLGSLSRGDFSQCRLSEFSRLHLPAQKLPASELPAVENENDIALKVRLWLLYI
jgi:hypothetical protein